MNCKTVEKKKVLGGYLSRLLRYLKIFMMSFTKSFSRRKSTKALKTNSVNWKFKRNSLRCLHGNNKIALFLGFREGKSSVMKEKVRRRPFFSQFQPVEPSRNVLFVLEQPEVS